MPRVIVARGVLNSFVRRAKKAYPREYIEAVLGKVQRGEFVIHAFYPLEHRGTARTVTFSAEALEEVRQVAQDLQLRWIGSIHTHPECEAVPSGYDILSAASDGELVMGICSLARRKGRIKAEVRFWPGIVPLRTQVVGHRS